MTPSHPFPTEERDCLETLTSLGGPLVVCVNDPPWQAFCGRLRSAGGVRLAHVVEAWDMDVDHLAKVATGVRTELDGAVLAESVVVGFGGGTALDTAKYLAWTLERPLVQIPTITSVDAGFTDAVGVRNGGRVRYIGHIVPELVVLDLPLIRSAPRQLNRAGIGDILSCHTGLFDWRLAADVGHDPAWDVGLAALGASLLDELEAATEEVAAVTESGVRFLADAYQRIGAACATAGHSRFEEGSEHFWAYAYEHRTGAHLVHGEIIAFAVCALAHIQDNDPERARDIVVRSHVRANPDDLGIGKSVFRATLEDLSAYSRSEGLDIAVADLRPVTPAQIDASWAFVSSLPHRRDDHDGSR